VHEKNMTFYDYVEKLNKHEKRSYNISMKTSSKFKNFVMNDNSKDARELLNINLQAIEYEP